MSREVPSSSAGRVHQPGERVLGGCAARRHRGHQHEEAQAEEHPAHLGLGAPCAGVNWASRSAAGSPVLTTRSRTWRGCGSVSPRWSAATGRLSVGAGPVRTGVTVVVPHDGNVWEEPLFAGAHRLNGNGELTGLEWIRESGMLMSLIGLTNTHSVGVVRDALVGVDARERSDPGRPFWALPGGRRDLGRRSQRRQRHARDRRARPRRLRGRLRRAGRRGQRGKRHRDDLPRVQRRHRQLVAGARAGVRRVHGRRPGAGKSRAARAPGDQRCARGQGAEPRGLPGARSGCAGRGVDHRARGHRRAVAAGTVRARLARRAAFGIGRTGGVGEHWSGDLLLAFSTANRGMPASTMGAETPLTVSLEMLADAHINALFDAVVEATEEAILNALLGAETHDGPGRPDGTGHRSGPVARRAGSPRRQDRVGPRCRGATRSRRRFASSRWSSSAPTSTWPSKSVARSSSGSFPPVRPFRPSEIWRRSSEWAAPPSSRRSGYSWTMAWSRAAAAVTGAATSWSDRTRAACGMDSLLIRLRRGAGEVKEALAYREAVEPARRLARGPRPLARAAAFASACERRRRGRQSDAEFMQRDTEFHLELGGASGTASSARRSRTCGFG